MPIFRPIDDQVLVRRHAAEKTTASGLAIPGTAEERPLEGTVLAVGPGKRLDDDRRLTPTVKAGDHVVFRKYGGTEVRFDGAECLVIREEEILGVVEAAR